MSKIPTKEELNQLPLGERIDILFEIIKNLVSDKKKKK